VPLKSQLKAALARLKPEPEPVPLTGSSLRALEQSRALTGDRLLQGPVFILSSVRSGSTLLRAVLNAHSKIHAPHELHLTGVKVQLSNKYTRSALAELDLDTSLMQYLLWDRLLHRELMRHGKQVIANKTPSDAMMWERIVASWPDVKFIYLLRHPAAVTDSWQRARKDWSRSQVAEDVLRYMVAVEDARTNRGGLTVRYEDLTIEPERETKRMCEFIGVDWEPGMLDYGAAAQGTFRAGLGDWSKRIRSGRITAVERLPEPEEIPAELIDISKKWGYLP
jgi:sulfotransferase family protein